MKGPNWVGVTFHGGTEPETVFRLLDQAVSQSQRGYTIVLEQKPTSAAVVYADTPLSAPGKPFPSIGEEVPEKIYQMRGLYQCREGTFAEKCQNFYRQGKFMEDYEDDRPWNGDYTRYFPTYHDLNVRQLRGYFTWRAQVRRGEFTPIATSMAYIYVYELLNGIGAASPEDALEKLQAFQTGFVESGVGEASMGKNLRQWMLEFAVLHNLPPRDGPLLCQPPGAAAGRSPRDPPQPPGGHGPGGAGSVVRLWPQKAGGVPRGEKGGGKGRPPVRGSLAPGAGAVRPKGGGLVHRLLWPAGQLPLVAPV